MPVLDIVINAIRAKKGAKEAQDALGGVGAEAEKTTRKTTAANRALDSTAKSMRGLSGAGGQLRGVLASLGVAFSLQQVAARADEYTNLTNRLRLVTNGSAELAAVQQQLLQQANNSRVPLAAQADLYSKIARAGGALGRTAAQALEVTDAISKAVTISGAAGTAAEAAIIQLGQGLNAGVLRGEELNSVVEQTPRLAQAIADALGVPIGMLKTLGEQGKITSEVVFDGLRKQAATLNEEFSQMEPTLSQAFAVLGNNMTTLIGRLDSATNTTGTIAKNIISFSKTLPERMIIMIGAVQTAAVTIVATFDQLLLKAQMRIAQGALILQSMAQNPVVRALLPGSGALSAAGQGLSSLVGNPAQLATDLARSQANERRSLLLIQKNVAKDLDSLIRTDTGALNNPLTVGQAPAGYVPPVAVDKGASKAAKAAEAARKEALRNSLAEDRKFLSDVEKSVIEVTRIFDETRTPAEQFNAEIEKLLSMKSELEAREGGLFDRAVQQTVDNFASQMEKLDESKDALKGFEEFGVQAARNMQTAFADFLFDPFQDGLKGMLSGFVNTLRRMAAELLAQQLLLAMFNTLAGGSSTGFWASLAQGLSTGAGAAAGGSRGPGMYRVNEFGPEMLALPSRAVVLNNQATRALGNDGGGAGKGVKVEIQTRGGETATVDVLDTAAGERRIMAVLERNSEQLKRRLGLGG